MARSGHHPQVVITPETASGGISGPKDCSAIIRLAYEGNNLYVQVLRFDNIVSFHQPLAKSFLQDNLEMCLNGFMDGCKFMCSPVTDLGTAVFAQRFMGEIA